MPERKIAYQRLEHKADSGFLVTAPSLARLYIDAALVLTDHLVKLPGISDREREQVKLDAPDKEGLMVKWLSEVLFLFEHKKFLSKRIVFDKFDGVQIQATLWGQKYEPLKHGTISEIKAVTYHQLAVGYEETPEPHFFARVFLDL